jgi:hypothetical protein
MSCHRLEILERVPVALIRRPLSRWHVARCPRCLRDSEGGEALPGLLVTADRIPWKLDLWPDVRKGIAAVRIVPRPGRRPWRWAIAATAAVLFLVAGVWLVSLGRRGGMPAAAAAPAAIPQVRLCSARIADQPARIIVVQSRDPNRCIFWIAKGDPRS